MTVSHWRRSPRPARLRCDVAVVGAGICGVSAALELQARGLDVLVLERDAVAAGASSRNAGFLMRGCADNYAAAVDQYGRARARELWRLTEENLRRLRALGADCLPSYRDLPSCLLALDPAEREELRRSHALLLEDGFESGWIEPGAVGADPTPADAVWSNPGGAPLAGLLNPRDASVSGHELLRSLAPRLARPVMERCEVHTITDEADGVALHAADRVVHARHALLCLNAYAPLLLPSLRGAVAPRRGQMLAARWPDAARPALAASYYANHGYEYFRQTPDGTIVVGGGRLPHADREVGYEDATSPEIQSFLESFTARVVAPGFEVIARWSGVMGFTGDGLPIIEPVTPGGRAWFVGGCTGHGMSMFNAVAALAVRVALDGEANPFALAGRPAAD